MSFVPLRKAVERLGLHPNTLRKYADEKRILTIRNAAGQRLFDVDAFLRISHDADVVCYCRVSSAKQRDDLERQSERLKAIHPQAEVVKDIGSGLNFKRKGFLALLGRLVRGDKLKVVVAHRDRLARFGVDAIRYLIEENGGELLVLDPYVETSKGAELTADLLAILHYFSCRMHGQRSHTAGETSPYLSNASTEELIQALVWHLKKDLQPDGGSSKSTEGAAPDTLDACGETDSPDIA